MDRERIIAELRRVADVLKSRSLTITQFNRHGNVSSSAVKNTFGSWNAAVAAAGLTALPQGPQKAGPKICDDELLEEIIRVTRDLGKSPSHHEFAAFGRYSTAPYRRRWGSFADARKVAYAKYGRPDSSVGAKYASNEVPARAAPPQELAVQHNENSLALRRRKRVQFGEPIDFRGLRFAPINEQGVVYLFGMISAELGFLIESIRTSYPDCEGKRCIDRERQR